MNTRERILDLVQSSPNIYFRMIMRELGLPIGQVQYHLYRLEKDGLISTKTRKNTTHFYPVKKRNLIIPTGKPGKT